MPKLNVTLPGRRPKIIPLCDSSLSIGRGEGCGLRLDDIHLAERHALLCSTAEGWRIDAIAPNTLRVDGQDTPSQPLVHGIRVRIGSAELTFLEEESPPLTIPLTAPLTIPLTASLTASPPIPGSREDRMVEGCRQLVAFSERLLADYELPRLLEELMDAVLAISHADKGFLILLESGARDIKVARNCHRETLARAKVQLSDSILDRVIATLQPLLITDALHHPEFSKASSIVTLRLGSVLCVPLLDRGRLLGALYIGNDADHEPLAHQALELLVVFAAQAALLLRNALLVNELRIDNQRLTAHLSQAHYGNLIGASSAMQKIYRLVDKVAATDVSILITGETGTGKELIARELHRRSPRARGPFVAINCGALPEPLLESELFGHVRGAFTGAVATRPGKFHVAHGGVLFLDEVGDMPPALQVKLLRVLEDRVVVRVGDHHPETVDIRIIAATHRDLRAEIEAGRFRQDLYWRLHVVTVELPPLRERDDDILLIARHFLHRFAHEYQSPVRGFSPQALAALKRHPWHGNIRELENHIKRSVLLASKAILGPKDLELPETPQPTILPLEQAREQFQRQYIHEVLAFYGGNRSKAARALGVDRRTLFRYLVRKQSRTSGRASPLTLRDRYGGLLQPRHKSTAPRKQLPGRSESDSVGRERPAERS